MFFEWLKNRKRDKLREAPFPERWLAYLEASVPHYAALTEPEQQVLQDDTRIFLHEKHWEGCGGLQLTEEMQVVISAQASLLSLNLERKYYPNVLSVLVYPSTYRARVRTVGPAGVVTEGYSHRLGEAWETGPVILSWQDVQTGGRNPRDGRNVVFHEFAHKLDMLNGRSDGTPRLYDDAAYERWYAGMKREWDHLVRAARYGRRTFLDPYGAENASELFAVATEAFFEKPLPMRDYHPDLYAVLQEYYRQDPADRLAALEYEEEERAR